MAHPANRQTHHAPQGELLVQMQINRGNATAGGANAPASAVMSVLVTLNGEPVSDLGASVFIQASAINLPAGWTLRNVTVAPTGCNVSAIEFLNQGEGLYDIRIVPFIDNPACAWLSGEYVYAIQLEFTRTIGGETVVLQGGTLGKLTVP
jgi:hypothetical protein